MQNLLIIFVKNPELGKVKSRLAKSIGDEMALSVYKKLLHHTRNVVMNLKMDKRVCYSKFMDKEDFWENDKFQKELQQGDDLGNRMLNAIGGACDEGYSKICIIGSDLLELEREIVEEAFQSLDDNNVVLGPAQDGGYYLIGVNYLHPKLFENKSWGTETVLEETISDIKNLKLKYKLLPVLNDIDEVGDIRERDKAYLFS